MDTPTNNKDNNIQVINDLRWHLRSMERDMLQAFQLFQSLDHIGAKTQAARYINATLSAIAKYHIENIPENKS